MSGRDTFADTAAVSASSAACPRPPSGSSRWPRRLLTAFLWFAALLLAQAAHGSAARADGPAPPSVPPALSRAVDQAPDPSLTSHSERAQVKAPRSDTQASPNRAAADSAHVLTAPGGTVVAAPPPPAPAQSASARHPIAGPVIQLPPTAASIPAAGPAPPVTDEIATTTVAPTVAAAPETAPPHPTVVDPPLLVIGTTAAVASDDAPPGGAAADPPPEAARVSASSARERVVAQPVPPSTGSDGPPAMAATAATAATAAIAAAGSSAPGIPVRTPIGDSPWVAAVSTTIGGAARSGSRCDAGLTLIPVGPPGAAPPREWFAVMPTLTCTPLERAGTPGRRPD